MRIRDGRKGARHHGGKAIRKPALDLDLKPRPCLPSAHTPLPRVHMGVHPVGYEEAVVELALAGSTNEVVHTEAGDA